MKFSTILAGVWVCLPLALAPIPASPADAGGSKYVEPKLSHAPYGEVRIVVPITSEDSKAWGLKMNNIRNALNAAAAFQGSVSVRVVLYSHGVQLLAQKDNEFLGVVDELRQRGVQFVVCNNTLRNMDIDFHTLHGVTDSDIVPSGFLEVAWLQRQGYVVDPSN